MGRRIEDYALIGDTRTAALVGRDGSIDWLCLPRFDSPACLASLLGSEEHGRFLLAPAAPPKAVRRRYRPGTLILETEFDTSDGTVRIIDFMPHRAAADGIEQADLVRIVEGVSGRVAMRLDLTVRFDYGSTVPWVHRLDGHLRMVAGPNALRLVSDVETGGEDFHTVAEFTVGAGERVSFGLTWFESHLDPPPPRDTQDLLRETEGWWTEWSGRCRQGSRWQDAVERSLITLKALTFEPTGGIVAAATTSLPELIGGTRNWDYRYCWLRDATYTLHALLASGYESEAVAWRDWLLRSVAGRADDLQVLYGAAGERWIPEATLDWLPGYEASRPVRVGNAAATQFQLDVYGEVLDAMHYARRRGIDADERAWEIGRELIGFLESNWREPDEGIWEVRGGRRQFTHSKVMAWLGMDRAVRACENGLEGPIERWRGVREEIHAEVCREGFHPARGAFTQSYGSESLDASLLLIPLIGFLPADDDRVIGTITAIERELTVNGFLLRYADADATDDTDGIGGGEGAFLLCSFWLAQALHASGRRDDAVQLFERLLSIRNDVGLLAEQYDPVAGRLLGNFPQAFSHVGVVTTAHALSAGGDTSERAER